MFDFHVHLVFTINNFATLNFTICFWESELVWGRSRARFDYKYMWFLHNLELVTDVVEVVS